MSSGNVQISNDGVNISSVNGSVVINGKRVETDENGEFHSVVNGAAVHIGKGGGVSISSPGSIQVVNGEVIAAAVQNEIKKAVRRMPGWMR